MSREQVEWELQRLATRAASPASQRDLRSLTTPPSRVPPTGLVKLCYSFVHAAEAVGIRDLADGEYVPSDTTLEQGIQRQLNYLLDEVGCKDAGFRLLEIGCGYGHLLRLARSRGAQVVGVNISREQVDYCLQQGLNVHHCTYRDLLTATDWHGQFDGVIANGSLEHWVQPEDVQAGKMNDLYRESFEIVDRLLNPARSEARYVTTAIHVQREVKPEYLLAPWWRQPWGSDRRHFSLLHHWMGGWYPVEGQLALCAAPYFDLAKETDGTRGYKNANDFRLTRMQRGLYTSPTLLWRIARTLAVHPWIGLTMLECFFVEQSWDWQFRGSDPPMKLLRQTWRRRSQG
jgi:cyclopropane fatty-acyl-phospholipid synthase-like methyltransferase